MGRADLRFARGNVGGAEEDFLAARAIAEQMSMKQMMIYPLKDWPGYTLNATVPAMPTRRASTSLGRWR